MSKYVDLHAHTTYSDGHDTPSEVVKMAAEQNVSILGIADHDNLEGLKEALVAGKKYGVKIVCGVEISTVFHNSTIHLLGYGLPLDDAAFNSFLSGIYRQRKNRLLEVVKKLNEKFNVEGRRVVNLKDYENTLGKYFNFEKTAQYLIVNGFFTDFEKTRKLLIGLSDGGGYFVSVADAIRAVHEANGLAILSHPFARGTSLKKIDPTPAGQEVLLKEIIAAGIDGMECYQSEYGPEETALALALALKYNLLVSAGSDWHGAICDIPGDMKDRKSFYPEHVGGLKIAPQTVAPFLERLGINVDKD